MGEERLEFPEITDVDIVFGCYPEEWFEKVLKEWESPKECQDEIQRIFFEGGSLTLNKELPKEYINSGLRILKAVLGSFRPKHEHKIRVCGAILNAIL